MVSKNSNFNKLPSLSAAMYGFVALFAAVGLLAFTIVADRRLEQVESGIQSESVYLRGEALRMNFAKALEREWNSINAVAGTLDVSNVDGTRPRLTAISRISNSIAWTGMADASGRLVASSQPVLEGRNVSNSRWFTRGLAGTYAGTVDASDSLVRLVPSDSETDIKFLDMSVAIRDAYGRAEGVLLYRLNLGWIASYLEESADALQMDVFLVDGRGQLIISHHDAVGQPLSSRGEQIAASGQSGVFRISSPGQEDVFLAAVPKLASGDLAALDWRLLTRVPTGINRSGPLSMPTELVWLILGLGLALMAATSIFIRYFLSPLQDLAQEAVAIAEGNETYPSELRSSREAARLSSAIVRLQNAA